MLPDFGNPLDGLIGRITQGNLHRIAIAGQSGFTGVDIERILLRYGIRVWGREPSPDGDFACLVRSRQAGWAQYLLARARVPVINMDDPDAYDRYKAMHGGTMPAPGSKHGTRKRTFVTSVVDALQAGGNTWIDNATFAPRKPKKRKRKAKQKQATKRQKVAKWFGL